MLSLTGALSVALSGLQASTSAAQIISGNISNSQTPGYTEKTVNTSSSVLGDAVINGYTRVTDNVLSSTLNSATSNASYLSTQNGYMTQVQEILDSSGNPPALTSAISNFQSAWTQYAASPDSSIDEQAVVAAGQQLASTVDTTSSQTLALQTQVQSDLGTTVSTLNTNLAKIQNLNSQIATALASGQPVGDLEDQRDQAVTAVAAITNVQVMQRPNDAIALYTPGGTSLVDGSAQVFSVSPSGNSVVNSLGADVSNVLTGGSLQAQTDFLSTSTSTANGVGVIGKITSQLQNFANMFVNTAAGGFADTYNSASSSNSSELGSGFFTASLGANGLPELDSFGVNSALVAGTSSVKQASATAVANTFTASNLAIDMSNYPTSTTTTSTFTATGLTANNQTYAGVASSILSGFQQSANAIQTASTAATAQKTYYQNSLTSETGVDTDTELINLTNWQNSYAAVAHVVSTIQSMYTVLEGMVS
jgi:flagellar hook-associated protein 1 FlgK